MMKGTLLHLAIVLLVTHVFSQTPVIIDHTSTVLSEIPKEYIDSAKQKLHIGYGHTSHGSQLATGMDALEAFFPDGTFDWSNGDVSGQLHMFEGDMWSQDGWLGLDIGAEGWDDETREYLDAHPDCNVIIWAWCGLVNPVTERDVLNHYLLPMQQLEQEYPEVTFVYMTGPLDGLGPDGAVKQANDSIRNFCEENNKILYDFADIEKYDPDMITNYQEYGADDECFYDPDGSAPYNRTENWAANWVSQNPGDSLTQLTNQANSNDCDFGHTHCLNCVLKGIAAWHLWAKIAGWGGSSAPPDVSTSFTTESGYWNNPENWDNGIPDSTTLAVIPSHHTVTIDENAQCSTLTLKPYASLTLLEGDTLETDHIQLKAANTDSSTASLAIFGWMDSRQGISVETYTETDHWYPISSPVIDALSESLNASIENLYYWNAETGVYQQISNNTTNLQQMRGYQYQNTSAAPILTFEGSISQSPAEINLFAESQDTNYSHWNLLGNPYTAPIDWNHSDWNKEQIIPSIYFNQPHMNQPCSYVHGISNPAGCFDGIIAPMNAFWVYAKEAGSIAINPATQNISASKQYTGIQKGLRIQLTGMEEHYETAIHFSDSATFAFDDTMDALHFKIPSVESTLAPGLFSLDSMGKELSINSLPDTGSMNIQLGYTILNSGDHTFSISESYNMSDTLYLLDLSENKSIKISHRDYTFLATRGTNDERFVLTDVIKDTAMNIHALKNKIVIYGRRNSIIIENSSPSEAEVSIYNQMGQVVYANKLFLAGSEVIPLKRTGFFIVVVQNAKERIVKKVFIQ